MNKDNISKDIRKKFLTAAEKGDIKTTASLLERGIDPDCTDEDEPYTALILSSKEGHLKMIDLLIEKGADVNFGNGVETALHAAIYTGCADRSLLETVNLLIKKGADVNAVETGGRTALHLTSREGLFAESKLLIENGANVNAKDYNDYTALHLASDFFYVPEHNGGIGGVLETIKILIENGADIEAQSELGWTALHFAANAQQDGLGAGFRDQLEITKLLVEMGAYINAQNGDGWTALHFAIAGDQMESAEYLIEQGANAKMKNNNGKTPLDLAKTPFAKL